MDRTSFRAAALAATASLVIARTDARADPGGPTPDHLTADTEQPAQPAAPAETTAPGEAPLEQAAAEESPQPQASSEASSPSAGPASAADGAESVSQETSPGPPPSDTSSPSGQESESGPPASHGGVKDTPDQLLGGVAPGLGTIPLVSAPIPAEPVGPEPRGGSLEQVLTGVERELRTVQAQIDDLRRRLERGAPLPRSRLARLRSTLERIAPALAALDVRLDAADRLSPRLRELVRRVRTRVTGVRASARGLAAAVSDSGVRSPELRRLLHALERFRALSAALVPGAGEAPAPSQPGAGSPYMHARPPIAASRWPALVATPEGHVAGRHPIALRDRGQPHESPPWSSAPGSTTASAGGAFAAAGLALLAILLIAAAQAQRGARLELHPGRRYAAAFPSPLERPG